MAWQQTLHDFYSLKFVKACSVARNVVYLGECCAWAVLGWRRLEMMSVHPGDSEADFLFSSCQNHEGIFFQYLLWEPTWAPGGKTDKSVSPPGIFSSEFLLWLVVNLSSCLSVQSWGRPMSPCVSLQSWGWGMACVHLSLQSWGQGFAVYPLLSYGSEKRS